jgi:hypothetical protein
VTIRTGFTGRCNSGSSLATYLIVPTTRTPDNLSSDEPFGPVRHRPMLPMDLL